MFWENHDPTQGMRQGNDVGTQYRSGVYCFDEEQLRRRKRHETRINGSCRAPVIGAITTEILPAPEFYYAEDYHQQYLAKNPNGYCGIGGTGVSCPVGVVSQQPQVSSRSLGPHVRTARSDPAANRRSTRDADR